VTEHWAWVYVGRPELVAAAHLVPFADWGSTPIFSMVEPLPGPALCPLRWHGTAWPGDDLGGWRLEFTRSGWRRAQARSKPMAPPASSPNRPPNCWEWLQPSQPSRSPPARCLLRAWRRHYRAPHVREDIDPVKQPRRRGLSRLTYVPSSGMECEGLAPSANFTPAASSRAGHTALPAAWRLESQKFSAVSRAITTLGPFTSRTFRA